MFDAIWFLLEGDAQERERIVVDGADDDVASARHDGASTWKGAGRSRQDVDGSVHIACRMPIGELATFVGRINGEVQVITDREELRIAPLVASAGV